MPSIFISYTRCDTDKVQYIVDDIETLDHTSWYDHKISGGQEWWDEVLHQIRLADIFIFLLSHESLKSEACSREYNYAFSLQKPIIPILISDDVRINLLPPPLSRTQIVDYRSQDKSAGLKLARSLTTAVFTKILPDPLPPPPEAPISYLGGIAEQLKSNSELNLDQQSGILIQINRLLKQGKQTDDVITLLRTFRNRRGLYVEVADEIDEILKKYPDKNKKIFIQRIFKNNNKETVNSEDTNKKENTESTENINNIATDKSNKVNYYAIASLIIGLISIVTSGIPSIIGIITGHISISKIKKHPDVYGLKKVSIIGLILSYFFFAVLIIATVANTLPSNQ